MIGCPIGPNREWIAQFYLNSLYGLEYPKKRIHLDFLYNYPKDAKSKEIDHTRCMLETFKESAENEYRTINIHEYHYPYDYNDNRVPGRDFEHFSSIRNMWLDLRENKDEYIFSVDSDILFPTTQQQTSTKQVPERPTSNILNRLIAWDKPIVAALVYNGLTMGNQGDAAYNFMTKISEQHLDGSARYIHRPLGLLEIDSTWKRDKEPPYFYRMVDLPKVCMTGACMLIRKDVLDAGVKFSMHEQGEDISFSENAIAKGFDCYMDFTQQVHHVMNPKALNELLGLPPGVSVIDPRSQVQGGTK